MMDWVSGVNPPKRRKLYSIYSTSRQINESIVRRRMEEGVTIKQPYDACRWNISCMLSPSSDKQNPWHAPRRCSVCRNWGRGGAGRGERRVWIKLLRCESRSQMKCCLLSMVMWRVLSRRNSSVDSGRDTPVTCRKQLWTAVWRCLHRSHAPGVQTPFYFIIFLT